MDKFNEREPLVSVIMPAYRCASTICEAIDSALIQEVPLEVLVIDDCSPEDLSLVLKKYENNDSVIYLRNEQNMGSSKSRNRGVSLARGAYVAFLDADDVWAPGKLKKQLDALEMTGTVLCCTARELMSATGERTGRVFPVKPIITYRELLKQNSISCSSVLLRTDVAREFPMDHDDGHEDYIMWMGILKKYGKCCGVNEPLLKYRLSNTGKSGSKWKSARMTFRSYRYMGFSWPMTIACFFSYALHGVIKYAFSRRHRTEQQK